MDDREPVREHRPIRGLRDEVIHHAEKRRRQEERDSVVAVPPLHERVLHAGIHRVALEQADRQLQRVDDVEQRDGDEGREIEPDRHIHVPLAALDDRAEHVPAEDDPDARVIAMSIGHSSSAYSLLVVKPSGSVSAAATMISCQPQKWIALSLSLNMRALHSRCSE